jgi:hypothetical protein
LAWATAGLLGVGLVSAGAVTSGQHSTDVRIVTAAGDNTGAVDVPTTAGSFASPPAVPPAAPPTAPPTTPAPAVTVPATTAVPKPVTVPTTKAPVTTQPARTVTTAAPVATTTPSTASGRATVTLVSQLAYDIDVTLNGRAFRVTAGQSLGPVAVDVAANGNDIVEARLVVRPSCGSGDAERYFTSGGTFRLMITPVPGMCFDLPGFSLTSTPA